MGDPTLEWALSASMSAAVGLGRDAAERSGVCAPHGKDCLASGADSEMAAGMPYDAIAVSSDLKV